VLKKQVLILENLCNLEQLPDFFLFLALPLKIRGGSGSPIRAVAVV
jgi:kynurenine formamidase